jgi:hypothetical protein
MKKIIALVALFIAVGAGVAVACPRGTHPVCQYDPSTQRSYCVCV